MHRIDPARANQLLQHGPEHLGLGTDLDGGFNAAQSPLKSLGDLKRLPAMLRRHFSAAQVEGVMGGNWLGFLSRSLPTAGSG